MIDHCVDNNNSINALPVFDADEPEIFFTLTNLASKCDKVTDDIQMFQKTLSKLPTHVQKMVTPLLTRILTIKWQYKRNIQGVH